MERVDSAAIFQDVMMQRKDSFDQLSAMLRMDSLPKLDEAMFARGARAAEAAAAGEAGVPNGVREASATHEGALQALRQLSSADLSTSAALQ